MNGYPGKPRVCPSCGNPIHDDDALLCLFCGESLGEKRRFLRSRVIFIVVALLVLLSFIALAVR